MDPFTTLSRRPVPSKCRMVILCSDCQLEVRDPGEPLMRFRCPRCSGVLMGLKVPTETGFDSPLPPAMKL